MTTKIGVVIPYFQRTPSILAKAVSSVLAQNLPSSCTVHVVVVDDESPIPATDELATMVYPPSFTLEMLSQHNAGPGAARNTALDRLDCLAVDFVAFLDSDDIWRPEHIRTALAALGNDADLYFSNHTRFNIATSFFEEKSAPESALNCNSGLMQMEPLVGDIYRWTSSYAAKAFSNEYVSQTSTVVARWDRVRGLRFDSRLRGAGEDALFWVDIALVSREIRFSKKALVHCGTGVNIFHGAYDWHSKAGTNKFGYLILMSTKIRQRGFLSKASKQNARKAELVFAYLTVRGIFRGHKPDGALFRSLLVVNPAVLARMPFRCLQYLVIRKNVDWSK